ncbi:MAG: 50S ribosomal protein L10 [Candidatus Tectomicrobia bacterium]|uniref:Large ribosomal subunit protein uL10 n=1 Tax=Tectimicrobiota bacterium TaxID=2528274 RepID=A0A933LQJ5_UNCTE|nr:50S ribosomal protein L10 [Candidatus Tectomicrobia bacterium]
MVEQVKVEKVEQLHQNFLKIKGAIVAEYRGLNVAKMTELRRQLRGASIEFQVIKNRLAKLAAQGTPVEPIAKHFVGPTSLAFSYDDPVALAKLINIYAKKEPLLAIKAGLLDGKAIDSSQVKVLADLPSREILLAKLLGSLQAPISSFVGVLSGVIRQFVYTLNAIKEQKEKEQ